MGFSKLFLISAIVAAVVLLITTPARSQETENEREFSYKQDSDVGPQHWAHIHEDWAACGNGRLQSPIDLKNERVRVIPNLVELRRSYRPGAAVMKNRGHDIMLKWEHEVGGLVINRTKYELKQIHWHSPSEHTVNGRRYSMEMHMLHESAAGKMAVVGILYTIGRPDPFLSKMDKYIKKMEELGEEEEEAVGVVDPMELRWGSRKYYRYLGSLTTPPCTEGVAWTIIKKVRTVSREQVNLLKEAVHDDFHMNARPTQLIHKRTIGMFRPQKVRY